MAMEGNLRKTIVLLLADNSGKGVRMCHPLGSIECVSEFECTDEPTLTVSNTTSVREAKSLSIVVVI